MDSQFKDFGNFMLAMMGLAAALTLIWFIVVVAFFAASLIGAAASYYAVKSGKALVTTNGHGSAIAWSFVAAGGLTTGLVLGSLAIVILTTLSSSHAIVGSALSGPEMNILVGSFYKFDNWIMDDASSFFIHMIPVCYCANRVFVARSKGGHAILGVIPAFFAMVVFSIVIHADELRSILSADMWSTVAVRALSALTQPIELAQLALQSPNDAVALVKRQLQADWPNLFALVHFFPTVFLVLGTAFAARSLAG